MSQTTMTRGRGSYVERPSSASLADVINIILDKGIVIDAFVRVSLVGIEVITIDARIVIASVDTYLRFAEATNRLDLAKTGGRDLPELFQDLNEGGASGKTKGIIGGVKEALTAPRHVKALADELVADLLVSTGRHPAAVMHLAKTSGQPSNVINLVEERLRRRGHPVIAGADRRAERGLSLIDEWTGRGAETPGKPAAPSPTSPAPEPPPPEPAA